MPPDNTITQRIYPSLMEMFLQKFVHGAHDGGRANERRHPWIPQQQQYSIGPLRTRDTVTSQ